ncbi:MAG: hypothetical protein ACMUHX_11035 [bacterium]
MYHKKNIIIIIMVIMPFICFIYSSYASQHRLVNFQGHLTDRQGNALDGTYNIKFSIYPSDPNAGAFWTEEHNDVTVNNGIVNVLLGSITNFDEPVKITFDEERYLGITIDCDHDPNTEEPEMTPRQRILSAIYSYNADKLDGKDSSEYTTPQTDAGRPGVAEHLYEGNTRLVDKYLGKGAKAEDSDRLDGYHATISGSDNNAIPVINSGITYGNLQAGYASSAGSVHWNNISSRPSSFTPSTHKHTRTSDCYWANWGLCLDHAGQCTCDYSNGYVMVGVERSDDKYLYNWERTLCCRVR